MTETGLSNSVFDIFEPAEKRHWPFCIIAWMCSVTCTIVGSSAGDVEQAKLDELSPVFVPLSQIWFVFVFSF
jgi:hypothetical protein